MKQILRDYDGVKALMPKVVKNTENMNLLPLVIIVSHMMQIEEMKDPAFKENLSIILKLAPQLINMMMEVAMELQAAYKMGQCPKKMVSKNFIAILEMSQNLIQGRWLGDEPLLQLPGFTIDVIKNYRKQLKENQIPDIKIQTFANLTAEQRAQLCLFEDPA